MPQTVGIPLARPALQMQQEELSQQLRQAVGCSRRIPEIDRAIGEALYESGEG